MAHSLSAKKRNRQNTTRRKINRARKSQIKTQIKHFDDAIEASDFEAAQKQYRIVARQLDKTAGSSTMHKKTAARKKSRLVKRLNALKH